MDWQPKDLGEAVSFVEKYGRDRGSRFAYHSDFVYMISNMDLGLLTSLSNELKKNRYSYLKGYVVTSVFIMERERTKAAEGGTKTKA